MARKSYKPEEIIKLLRLVEIEAGKGQTTGLACKQLGFTEQSYYRWAQGIRWSANQPGKAIEGPGKRECPPEEAGGRPVSG